MASLINLCSQNLKYTGVVLQNPHRVSIPQGISVLIGPNGAGKSSLAKVLEQGWNYMTNHLESAMQRPLHIKRVEFNDIHTLSAYKGEYYQQRFESTVNDQLPTVAEILGSRIHTDQWRDISRTLGIDHIIDKKINYLSSGELRKLLISNILTESPDLLILDNPYIGLDAPSRAILDSALQSIADHGLSVLLLVGCADDIPECAHTAIPITDMTIGKPVLRTGDMSIHKFRNSFDYLFDFADNLDYNLLTAQPDSEQGSASGEIVSLRHCCVKYGPIILLNDVSWSINQGECWLLAGPNGSGKSTLLSLINADNPQGYSNDIYLFGRRRGSGESIWEIKRNIGYISPERHLYFNAYDSTALDVAIGGLKDALTQYLPPTDQQTSLAMRWLDMLKISHLANRKFATLSFGEQRLALLARTLIKTPPLLILDEPLHGLDAANKQRVNKIIDQMVETNHSTLIYVTHYEEEVPQCVTLTKRLSRQTGA